MVTDPNEALNPETVKTAVSAYNAEINKLQGTFYLTNPRKGTETLKAK